MSSNIIYTQGTAEDVTIPAGESIAVFTRGTTVVKNLVGAPNQVDKDDIIGTVTDGQTVFGPYATGATITLEGTAAQTLYQVGTDPVITELYAARLQEDPAAVNVTADIDTSDLLTGIVTSTTAAAVAGTVPTGTEMDAASEFAIGDSFDWSVINTGGANAFTVTANTGHTLVGAAAVANSTSGAFRTRKTAANTFITYRIS